MKRAIFLDRDGTLNRDSANYITHLSEFVLFDFTVEALRKLQQLGFKLIVISNQSAIARGLTTRREVERIHSHLRETLAAAAVRIDAIYYCPHHPDEDCDCRKPATGNVELAIRDFKLDPRKSYFIGDAARDIETGARVGCRTILVKTGITRVEPQAIERWPYRPDHIVENLREAAELVEKIEKESE